MRDPGARVRFRWWLLTLRSRPWPRCVGVRWRGRPSSGRRRQVGDLGGAVLAAVHYRDQVGFLTSVELGLLAAQSALGLGDLHAFAGAQPDQVGLNYVDNSGLSCGL